MAKTLKEGNGLPDRAPQEPSRDHEGMVDAATQEKWDEPQEDRDEPQEGAERRRSSWWRRLIQPRRPRQG